MCIRDSLYTVHSTLALSLTQQSPRHRATQYHHTGVKLNSAVVRVREYFFVPVQLLFRDTDHFSNSFSLFSHRKTKFSRLKQRRQQANNFSFKHWMTSGSGLDSAHFIFVILHCAIPNIFLECIACTD